MTYIDYMNQFWRFCYGVHVHQRGCTLRFLSERVQPTPLEHASAMLYGTDLRDAAHVQTDTLHRS